MSLNKKIASTLLSINYNNIYKFKDKFSAFIIVAEKLREIKRLLGAKGDTIPYNINI